MLISYFIKLVDVANKYAIAKRLITFLVVFQVFVCVLKICIIAPAASIKVVID